jgi:hypothetical protein
MNLFKIVGKERVTYDGVRLDKIKKTIEASVRYEEEAMSKPLNASTLKRIYNIESLWIHEGSDVKKLGSADYMRELKVFKEAQENYGGFDSMRIDRGQHRYHVVEKGGKIYLFSTPLELTKSDIVMMLEEIERSLEKKKLFLSSNTNITEE